MDGDNKIGIDAGELSTPADEDGNSYDVSGYQIKVSSAGTVHLWDGNIEDDLIDVRDVNVGTPDIVDQKWGRLAALR